MAAVKVASPALLYTRAKSEYEPAVLMDRHTARGFNAGPPRPPDMVPPVHSMCPVTVTVPLPDNVPPLRIKELTCEYDATPNVPPEIFRHSWALGCH